jgi:SAM-dependent methyltransferase
MMFFDQYPEFVDRDLRKTRGTTQVTSESLSKRCEVLLPQWSIKGMRVLDLGHCVGAMGQWCLANGAKHYTGVDIQKDFCEVSTELLTTHWSPDSFTIINQDVLEFMEKSVERGEVYDVILASGIIHGYFNTVGFVELMTKLSSKYIVVESQEVDEPITPTISFKIYNMLSNKEGYPYMGWTAVVGFNALRAIMGEYGFDMHGDRIYPEKIINTHDAYNDNVKLNQEEIYGSPQRFMVRYVKSLRKINNSLQYKVTNNVQKYQKGYINLNTLTIDKAPVWKFDESVAKRFQEEATSNIPDYERVIDMCIEIAKRKCNEESTIVDIGSALGHTIQKFNNAGYKHVFGVESSQAMINTSKQQAYIKLSDTFPSEWHPDFVMANWTLHFVNERKQYIQDVYNALQSNGTFILSDKTPQSDDIKELYYDFKRSNGVSDEYIYEKEQKLKGYMNLLPVEWYLDTMKEVGFKNIQIINSRFGFVTFYGEK